MKRMAPLLVWPALGLIVWFGVTTPYPEDPFGQQLLAVLPANAMEPSHLTIGFAADFRSVAWVERDGEKEVVVCGAWRSKPLNHL